MRLRKESSESVNPTTLIEGSRAMLRSLGLLGQREIRFSRPEQVFRGRILDLGVPLYTNETLRVTSVLD